MRPAPTVFACLALLAAFSNPLARAAGDKLQLGAFGPGKASGPLLTRAELRECLATNERMRVGSEAAGPEREQIERDKNELIRQGAELKAQLETLDRTSQEAIEQYRARAIERDRAIDALEARTAVFNQKVETLQADKANFARRCENRRFDELDASAIRAGK